MSDDERSGQQKRSRRCWARVVAWVVAVVMMKLDGEPLWPPRRKRPKEGT